MVCGRAVLVDVDALLLALRAHPQEAGGGERPEDGAHDDEGDATDGQVAPDLRPQLTGTTAPEQTLHRRVAELTGGEQTDRPGAPDATAAVHGDGTDRIVDAEVLDEIDADDDDHTGDQPDDHRAGGVHPVARRGDPDQAAEEAVDRDADVPLLEARIDVRHRREAARRRRQRGVGGDPADAERVDRRQRAARVEAVPAEPQDDATEGGDVEVVTGRHAAAVTLEPPTEARAEDDRTGQGD